MKYFLNKTISLLLLLMTFSVVQAQNSLFAIDSGNTLPSPPPFIIATYDITLDFDMIKGFPESIQLTFADASSTIVPKGDFIPRAGYIFRDDETGSPGTPEFWINPLATQEQFSFKWSGSNDDFDVVITAYKGLLSATISGISGRFVIEKQSNNYQLVHVNLAGFPSYEGDTIDSVSTKGSNENQDIKEDKSYITNLKSFSYENEMIYKRQPRIKDVIDPNVIDMLVVYNEAARIEAGGLPLDPNDTLHIEQKIIAEVDNLNVALSNSNNTTRATRFHVAQLNDFVHAANRGAALNNFRDLNSVKTLRNQVGADVVSGIINTNYSTFYACGLAFGHTAANSNSAWTIGAGFSEYAYNIISQACMLYDFTFTHEFGHLLGAHHARDEPYTEVTTVTNNGFPHAFAWRDGSFKSILTTTQSTTSRRLNFSNPNKYVDGFATGVINFSHNQRVIDELTVFATNYRQHSDLIFINGFE